MAKNIAPKSNRPIHTLRHRNLQIAIWRNNSTKGPFYKINLVRSYKKGEEWLDTQSFGYDDLMNIAKLMYDAHSYISAAQANDAVNRKPSK